MREETDQPYEPPISDLGSNSHQRSVATGAVNSVRGLYCLEMLIWLLIASFGWYLRTGTLEASFPNREMALTGELLLTLWAILMMMLAVTGLVRAKGLLLHNPVAINVATGVRLVTLAPMTVLMLVISAAGFAA